MSRKTTDAKEILNRLTGGNPELREMVAVERGQSAPSTQDSSSDPEEEEKGLADECLEERAKRGSREKFEAALASLPDVEAEDYDRL